MLFSTHCYLLFLALLSLTGSLDLRDRQLHKFEKLNIHKKISEKKMGPKYKEVQIHGNW